MCVMEREGHFLTVFQFSFLSLDFALYACVCENRKRKEIYKKIVGGKISTESSYNLSWKCVHFSAEDFHLSSWR